MGSFRTLERLEDEMAISRMINSFFYFFKFIFILKESREYRLIMIQDSYKIIDLKYKTIKGAKIACSKLLIHKTGNTKMKPEWSGLYHPDEKWLQDKLNRKSTLISTVHKEAKYLAHTCQ